MKPYRTLIAAMAILASTAALSACTQDNHDLPTLGGTAAQQTTSSLETVAKKYYDCMTDAGISVELDPNGEGQLAVVQFTNADYVMWRAPDGNSGAIVFTEAGNANQQAIDDFLATTDGGTALMIDGVDHSEAYAQCIAESGYNEQAAQGKIQMDPAAIERQVTANNKWAACARENGWPNVRDSAMPTDETWPTIFLPSTTTDDQLRQLLEACPNFDPGQQERIQQWWQDNPTATDYPDNYLPDPNIGFDQPSMSGSEVPSDQDEIDMERINHLYDILFEQARDYDAQHGG